MFDSDMSSLFLFLIIGLGMYCSYLSSLNLTDDEDENKEGNNVSKNPET